MLEAVVNQIIYSLMIGMISISLFLLFWWRMARRFPGIARMMAGWMDRHLLPPRPLVQPTEMVD